MNLRSCYKFLISWVWGNIKHFGNEVIFESELSLFSQRKSNFKIYSFVNCQLSVVSNCEGSESLSQQLLQLLSQGCQLIKSRLIQFSPRWKTKKSKTKETGLNLPNLTVPSVGFAFGYPKNFIPIAKFSSWA